MLVASICARLVIHLEQAWMGSRSAHLTRLATSFAAFAIGGLTATAADATLLIRNTPTRNMTCSAGVCTATARFAVLNVNDLANLIAVSDVTVKSMGRGVQILVDSPFSWTSAHQLTLTPDSSVTIERPLMVAGPGSLIIGGQKGSCCALWFGEHGKVSFLDVSSHLSIAGISYTLVDDISTLAADNIAYPNGNYALAHDYDASADGVYTTSPVRAFCCRFEGLKNTIYDLTIRHTGPSAYIGLFESSGISIQDLNLMGLTITVRGRSGMSEVGGLVGQNLGFLRNDKVKGAIREIGFSAQDIGGLAGVNYGGLGVMNSVANVNVKADGAINVGGIVGRALYASPVEYSEATGDVSGGMNIGGLVGLNQGSVYYSFASGGVTALAPGAVAGGLIGKQSALQFSQQSELVGSYATGSVTGASGTTIGGLLGRHSSGTVKIAYSVGALSGGSLVGGVIGSDNPNNTARSDLYWDMETSGFSDPSQGAGDVPNDSGITGLTDAQLKAALPAGFKPGPWVENPAINGGYPYLIYNPPSN